MKNVQVFTALSIIENTRLLLKVKQCFSISLHNAYIAAASLLTCFQCL